jgi:hypothetical protein
VLQLQDLINTRQSLTTVNESIVTPSSHVSHALLLLQTLNLVTPSKPFGLVAAATLVSTVTPVTQSYHSVQLYQPTRIVMAVNVCKSACLEYLE